MDCARWPASAITCFINAPLSGAEIFTIVLVDHEAWGCDLDARDINGPAWCIQLYLLWIDGFFARSEPWAKRGACRRAQFLGTTSLSVERQPMGTSLTCRPRDNRIAGNYCRLSGLNIEGLISAKELRNSTRRTWKVCLMIFKVSSWLRIVRQGSQGRFLAWTK